MIITYKSFSKASFLILAGLGMRLMTVPSLASIQGLMGSISQQYQNKGDIHEIGSEKAFSSPSRPDFLEDIISGIDDPEIKFLMGNPEEEMLTMPVDLYQDKPELAALVPQDNSVEGKNFWFDRYDYYSQLYSPTEHAALMKEFETFGDASPEQTALYLQMLADLEIPYRKPLKTFSKEYAEKTVECPAFTYNDQIAICEDLPFEHFRTTLYHEGQHLKHHDPAKIIILRAIINNELSLQSTCNKENIAKNGKQMLDDYRKFIEHRADYNTHHNHINCYQCNYTKATCIQATSQYRTALGYLSYEEIKGIADKEEKNNMLCAYHRHEQQHAHNLA